MDAPCDSGRRVAGGVGWGKRFGVSGMGDDVGGNRGLGDALRHRMERLLVPGTLPWNDESDSQQCN